MRVIGTGWRYWATSEWNLDRMYGFMDSLIDLVLMTNDPVLQLMLGGGHDEDIYKQGADWALMEWAKSVAEIHAEHVPAPLVFKADWQGFGKAAGPMRNATMILAGADLVVAFLHPDSKGTRDCLDKARRARIPRMVMEWETDPHAVDIPEQKVVEIDGSVASQGVPLQEAA